MKITVNYDNNPGWADGFPWVVAGTDGVLERFATLEECADYLRAIDTTDSPSIVHLHEYEVAQETYRAAAKAYYGRYERYESLTDEQAKRLRDEMLAADSAACAAWAKYIDSVDEEDA